MLFLATITFILDLEPALMLNIKPSPLVSCNLLLFLHLILLLLLFLLLLLWAATRAQNVFLLLLQLLFLLLPLLLNLLLLLFLLLWAATRALNVQDGTMDAVVSFASIVWALIEIRLSILNVNLPS